MQDLVGQYLTVMPGEQSIAAYDKIITDASSKAVGIISPGNSIGLVISQDDPNDPNDVGILANDGKTYYVEYDPVSMSSSSNYSQSNINLDPSNPILQSINGSTGGNTNIGQYDITITNTPNSSNATGIVSKIKPTLNRAKIGFIKYLPYIAGGLAFVILVSLLAKKKNK